MSENATARALSLLDLIDRSGDIIVARIVGPGYSRSAVARDIRALVNAGLLEKTKAGVYGPGPRYRVQPPGTRFDPGSRNTIKAWMARQLMSPPDGGQPYPKSEVAKMLKMDEKTLNKILRQF